MKRTSRYLLLAGLAFALRLSATAQCALTPAECPADPRYPYGSAEDSARRMGNPLLPREITMENRCRLAATEIMDQIASKEHWSYIELSEENGIGYNLANGSILKYPLRPPHWFTIHYQVVINEDSLHAWRSWLQDFAQRRMEAMTAAMKGNIDEKTANKQGEDFDKESQRMTFRYREGSIMIVEIEFNSDFARVVGKPAGTAPVTPVSGQILWLNNADPTLTITDYPGRSHHNAILLIGNWRRQPSGDYRPTWYFDKKATDEVSEKQIKSDQLQSIDVRLSGNPAAMKKWLADIDVAMFADGLSNTPDFTIPPPASAAYRSSSRNFFPIR